MLYLKIGIVVFLLIFVGAFVYQNYNQLSQEVTIHIPPFRKALGPSPMIIYFCLAFLLGMLLSGLPLLLLTYKNTSVLKKQSRIIESLKNEIHQLQLVNSSLSSSSGNDIQGPEAEEEEEAGPRENLE